MKVLQHFYSLVQFAIIISLASKCAYCGSISHTNSSSFSTKADLRFCFGIYKDGSEYLLHLFKTKKKQSSSDTSETSTPKNEHENKANVVHKNYSALAGISYVISTPSLGNFAAGVGYSYRVTKLEFASFQETKEKIKRDSLPYAELFWEKNGILLLESLAFRVGSRISIDKGNGVPCSINFGIKYKIGSITSLYAGVFIEANFPHLSGVDFKQDSTLYESIGIEFTI
ncbi:hypothetical protein [Anaplasma phagocytophilum]|uniref:hypothetical protein n=1 Tax=Anaplasma phagocytophilum TaxID=948 RepID=UPI00201B0857